MGPCVSNASNLEEDPYFYQPASWAGLTSTTVTTAVGQPPSLSASPNRRSLREVKVMNNPEYVPLFKFSLVLYDSDYWLNS